MESSENLAKGHGRNHSSSTTQLSSSSSEPNKRASYIGSPGVGGGGLLPNGTEETVFIRETLALAPDSYINHAPYTDFELVTGEGEVVGVSGIVLAANSPFIHHKICEENCRKLDIATLQLPVNQVVALVAPLYSGRIALSTSNLLNFLTFSTLFEFRWIFDCCVIFFTQNIRPELVLDFLELGLRTENHCLDRYKTILSLISKYLEEGNNMQLTCSYMKQSEKVGSLSGEAIEFLCKVGSQNVVEIVSLVLGWLQVGEENMELVPSLLDSLDFVELYRQDEQLTEHFFTHIITGNYTADIRIRIMNLSFNSYRNVHKNSTKNKAVSAFRMGRLKSAKRDESDL